MTAPYFLDASVTDAALAVRMNGIPLMWSRDNAAFSATSDVSVWIKPGLNVLTSHLFNPVPGREEAVEAEVRLFLADPAQEVVSVGTVLAEFVWPPVREDPAAPLPPLPQTVDRPLQVADAPPTRLWREAAPAAEIGEGDRQHILALVETLRQRLMAGDTAGAADLLEYKIADDALASGKSLDRVRGASLELLEWLVGNSLDSQPLDPTTADLSLLAGGRLVWVRRPDGSPALQLVEKAEGNLISIEVYAARVGGSWRIVR